MNRVTATGSVVEKRFDSPVAYEHEWQYFLKLGHHMPKIVKLIPEELTIVTERGDLIDAPTQSHINQVASIIGEMATLGIHHRDLHPGNIIDTPDGVKIIDWETAITKAGRPYDMFGPVDIPVPVQHGGLIPQWWNSNDPGSIRNKWKVDIPEWFTSQIVAPT